MKQLLYSILIIFLLTVVWVGSNEYADYQKMNSYTPEQVEQIHQAGNLVEIPPSYYTFLNLGKYLFYITIIVTFLLSLFYILKNKNLKGYFKSLIIPASLIIFSILGIVIISKTTSLFSGESGMGAFIILVIEGAALILSGLVNLIIYFARKN